MERSGKAGLTTSGGKARQGETRTHVSAFAAAFASKLSDPSTNVRNAPRAPWPRALAGAVIWLAAIGAGSVFALRLPRPFHPGTLAEAAILALVVTLPLALACAWAGLAGRQRRAANRIEAMIEAAMQAADDATPEPGSLPLGAEGLSRNDLTHAVAHAARDALDGERSAIARRIAELGEAQRRLDQALLRLEQAGVLTPAPTPSAAPIAPPPPAPEPGPVATPVTGPVTGPETGTVTGPEAEPAPAPAPAPASPPAAPSAEPSTETAEPLLSAAPRVEPRPAPQPVPGPETQPAPRPEAHPAPRPDAGAPEAPRARAAEGDSILAPQPIPGLAEAPAPRPAVTPAPTDRSSLFSGGFAHEAAPEAEASDFGEETSLLEDPPMGALDLAQPTPRPSPQAAASAAPDPSAQRLEPSAQRQEPSAPIPDDGQPSLPLDPGQTAPAATDWGRMALALDFPKDERDDAGWSALAEATQDRQLAELLQAAEDALTILAQHGIYMEDLQVHLAPQELWVRFAEGERGGAVAEVGGVRQEEAVETVRRMTKADPVFRDTCMHLMRRFDVVLRRAAADPRGQASLTALADSRTGRAFMLIAQSIGAFGAG